MCHLDLLVDEASLLGVPQVRQLAGKLRLYFGDRVWSVPDRISAVDIMLTVLVMARSREPAEMERAEAAMARCQDESCTADEEG